MQDMCECLCCKACPVLTGFTEAQQVNDHVHRMLTCLLHAHLLVMVQRPVAIRWH